MTRTDSANKPAAKSFLSESFTAFLLIISSLLMFCSISACSQKKTEYQTTLFSFGTLIDITLYDINVEQATRAFTRLEQDFQSYHHNWSPWETGTLYKLNLALKHGETFSLPDDFIPLIRQSISLGRQSRGLFNPTIGNLINLWQFHRSDEADIQPPSADQIKAFLDSHPGVDDLVLNGHTLSSTNPAVQLSLGAFAKGYGIQKALHTLTQMGISNAVINAGGDLVVSGKHGQRNWNIGIRHPRKESVIASVSLSSGESIFTSGDYERFYMHDNKRYHHILDPRTGYPSQGFTSVTVINRDAGVADAAATALMVAGPGSWFEIARNMKLDYVLLIDSNGTVIMNPKMNKRVKLDKTLTSHIIISEPL